MIIHDLNTEIMKKKSNHHIQLQYEHIVNIIHRRKMLHPGCTTEMYKNPIFVHSNFVNNGNIITFVAKNMTKEGRLPFPSLVWTEYKYVGLKVPVHHNVWLRSLILLFLKQKIPVS